MSIETDLPKKNVLVIGQTLSKRSGAGRLAYELVSRLQVLTNLTVLMEIGTEDSGIRAQTILEPKTPFVGFLRNCVRARKSAKGMDIVHALDGWPYGVYGYCAVVGTRRRLVIMGVGTYSVAPFERHVTSFLLTRAYKRAWAILCISAYTKKRIDEKLPGLPTSIMHMGTTLLPVPSKSQIAQLRTTLEIPENAYPVIVTVGEIKERKGQLDTLQALASLKELFPHALYILAGYDKDLYVLDIKKYAQEHGVPVRITAELKTDEDLASLYSIADIFALNSNNHETHFEGFGLVVLEAAQFGVPAIGSKDCGIEDAIQDGVSGILTGQMDHAAIASAIQKIASNKDFFRSGARAWYTRFTWQNTISIILKAYD